MGLGDLAFLSRLRPVSAEEAKLDPKAVRFEPEIEPLVRLLEDTPRDRLLEEVAAGSRRGRATARCSRRCCWPGVRNVQPRPSVGFKFHAVLVVNSAHLASLDSPDSGPLAADLLGARLLQERPGAGRPRGQLDDGPVDESAVPPARKAREAFLDAMERWDESAADAAVAGLARTAGGNEVYELFFRSAPATSARSATRRSTSPTASGRSSASAGSTPSRSCARWPTPC